MEFSIANPTEYASVPIEHRFEPYDDNGGWVKSDPIAPFPCILVPDPLPNDNTNSTSLAIAGKDFCVVASDTRQSTGYNINSRYAPKAYRLADNAVIAMNGFHADGLTLKKVLDQRLKVFTLQREGGEDMHETVLIHVCMCDTVVQVCTRQGDVCYGSRPNAFNHLVSETFLPLLQLLLSWRCWWGR